MNIKLEYIDTEDGKTKQINGYFKKIYIKNQRIYLDNEIVIGLSFIKRMEVEGIESL